MNRTLEIDLRKMTGENILPPVISPQHPLVL